jgi:N-acetyl-anhydromuramyl-L-alanine amidase AmpD
MNIIETNWEWSDGSGTKFEKRRSAEYLIFHHAAASTCTAAAVHRWHLARGWIGIGYHYFIDKQGGIWRGRPEYAAGAHTVGKNYSSIAVCFEGNFETDVMPQAQLRAGCELAADIKSRYPGIILSRHKDFDATACPGRNFPFDELEKPQQEGFADIMGHWAESDIKKCTEAGILKGGGDGLFRPDEPLTRAEFAAAIARML